MQPGWKRVRIRGRPTGRLKKRIQSILGKPKFRREVDLKFSVHPYNMKFRPMVLLSKRENRMSEGFSKNETKGVHFLCQVSLTFAVLLSVFSRCAYLGNNLFNILLPLKKKAC